MPCGTENRERMIRDGIEQDQYPATAAGDMAHLCARIDSLRAVLAATRDRVSALERGQIHLAALVQAQQEMLRERRDQVEALSAELGELCRP